MHPITAFFISRMLLVLRTSHWLIRGGGEFWCSSFFLNKAFVPWSASLKKFLQIHFGSFRIRTYGCCVRSKNVTSVPCLPLKICCFAFRPGLEISTTAARHRVGVVLAVLPLLRRRWDEKLVFRAPCIFNLYWSPLKVWFRCPEQVSKCYSW